MRVFNISGFLNSTSTTIFTVICADVNQAQESFRKFLKENHGLETVVDLRIVDLTDLLNKNNFFYKEPKPNG